jgi:two-component system sensor histidine kinase KdpD
MSAAVDPAAIPGQLATHLQASLDRPVRVWVANGNGNGQPCERARVGNAPDLPAALVAQAWDAADPGAFFSEPWTFFRLEAGDQKIGLAAVYGAVGGELGDSARSLCEQAGVAIDRSRLVGDLEETRLVYETEQLRSALLSSVSHDLRTPLASIIGSTTSLLEYGDAFSPADRRELLATILDESRRLDRHIQNLLDMTRIGRGGLSLRRDWVDLRDVVSGALHRLHGSRRSVKVVTRLPEPLPLLWVHGALLEQALVNLLDNALRFSPPEGTVTIEAKIRDQTMEIDVIDEGPGIPEGERELIFDMFYTARHGDRGRQGTGLGLTICRAMVGAHGGSVEALAGPGDRGARMRITLPMVEPAQGAVS